MAIVIKIYDKNKPRKTPKDRILNLENNLGMSYKSLSQKYDETYNTIYGRIYRHRKKYDK